MLICYSIFRELHNDYPVQCITAFTATANFPSASSEPAASLLKSPSDVMLSVRHGEQALMLRQ